MPEEEKTGEEVKVGSIQKVKNTYNNTKEDIDELKKKKDKLIEDTIKDFKNALGIAGVLCNNFPTTDISSVANDVKEALKDVIRILIELLVALIGIKLEELQKKLGYFLIEEIKLFSKNVKFTINDNIKSCFLCNINPLIPDWMITDGINIEISQFDFKDMFKINPNSVGGNLIYGDNTDLNRFLFDTIQSREEETWYYNQLPIATFEFIQEGSLIGYDESKDYGDIDNKGMQNIISSNNVMRMKISSSYQGQNIANFINDYINSLDPIIQSKKIIPSVMDASYGNISRLANLSYQSIIKRAEFDTAINTLVDEGAQDEGYQIDNSFTTFTNDELNTIKQTSDEMYSGEVDFQKCCCGNSSISNDNILNFNERLNKATNLEEEITITTNAINVIANESTNSLPESERDKGYAEFLANFLSKLSTIVISMVLTPKINYIFVVLQYMVNKESRFINVKDFIRASWCIIKDILVGILQKLIYGLIIPQIVASISDLVRCAIKTKIKRLIDEQLKTRLSLIPSLPEVGVLADVSKALNSLGSINSIGSLSNGVVDIGFNNINKKI